MNSNTTKMSLDVRTVRIVLSRIAAATLGTLLLLPAGLCPAATVNSSARSAAMGGAFTALAKGVDAPKYNPANLGLTDYQQVGIEFVSLGASVNNNAFTLSDYNNYTGAVLTTEDKQDILNKIPTEGLRVDADINATAMSVALGNIAFGVTGVGAADISLNKDIIDLILNGNTFADTIQVTGSYSDGLSYATVGLSYGLPVYSSGTRQLAVGLTAKYIKGIAVEELVELEGLAATYEAGFQGQGRAVVRTASGGSGYGLDLGAALKLNNSYSAGVRFENLLGHINWNSAPQEHGYIFEFDTATYDDFEEDDYIGSEDYSIDVESFSTSLPSIMNVGVAKTSGRLLWALDWTQGFKRSPGASTKPRLALGVEYSAFSFLPLRAGYATGGDRNTAFSFGSGISFFGFYLDAAIITGTSFSFYSTKGVNFALSTGLRL